VQDSYKNESDMDGSEIHKIALDSMIEILTQQYSRGVRTYYLLKAISNVMAGVSLYSSISVIVAIMEQYDSTAITNSEGLTLYNTAHVLDLIEQQMHIVDIIIKDFSLYDQ
jgi:hypothetical protein